jgi:hypothetical protein
MVPRACPIRKARVFLRYLKLPVVRLLKMLKLSVIAGLRNPPLRKANYLAT